MPSPMFVTESGINTSLRFLHPENAHSSMLVTEFGITILSKLSQHSNALHPINITLHSDTVVIFFTVAECAFTYTLYGIRYYDFLET